MHAAVLALQNVVSTHSQNLKPLTLHPEHEYILSGGKIQS